MSIPAIIIILLATANLASAYYLRNEYIMLKPWATVVSTVVYGALLFWGGFFS